MATTTSGLSAVQRVRTEALPRARFVAAMLLLATALGAVVAWHAGDLFIFDDAVSYLDVATAWLNHDWHSVANSYWSPGYSWILAASLGIFRPSGYWEPVVVRATSWFLYVVALLCFTYFWLELTRSVNRRAEAAGIPRQLPPRAWFVLGLIVFLYGALLMIGPYRDSPDMTVAAIVFLDCAILLRIHHNGGRWSHYATLGILLALGYYVKAVMFPLGLVFTGAAVLAASNKRQAAARAALTLAIFGVLCSPWILVLSRAKGRFTFGDSGKLNYLWYNDYGWSGDGYPFPWTKAVAGTPQHPMSLLLASPSVYEFSAPFHGSYPPWYDPSYWYDGAKVRLNLRLQLRRFVAAASSYERILERQTPLLAGALFLFFLTPFWGRTLRSFSWYLLVPALAGLAIYAPVRADNRYLAPFFVLIWATLFADLCQFHLRERAQLIAPLAVAISIALLPAIAVPATFDTVQTVAHIRAGAAFDHSDVEVAHYLKSIGLHEGDRVAYIQSAGDIFNKYWARLAKVTIVADIPYQDVDKFWNGDAAVQSSVLGAFRRAGARAVVAYKVPPGARSAGWLEAGKTDYYVLPLCRPTALSGTGCDGGAGSRNH